jgi:membrane protein YdbS with pleckstrin-like domain
MDQKLLATYLEFRPVWKSFSVYIFGAALFFFGPMINPQGPVSPALSELIATLFACFVLIKRYTNIYRVGADAVTHETSFPRHRVVTLPIEQIGRIDLRRGITQRLLGVAHVHLYRKGEEEPAIRLFGVPRPDDFRRLLLELGASDQPVYGAFRR